MSSGALTLVKHHVMSNAVSSRAAGGAVTGASNDVICTVVKHSRMPSKAALPKSALLSWGQARETVAALNAGRRQQGRGSYTECWAPSNTARLSGGQA